MKSTSSACNTSASAKWPMRTFAITGMVTVCMISRITLMAAIRATPPSLRISEGTRSSAITAQAPAFSAMRACSALVTSMMTPPFSISARPTLTRHSLELPLLALPFGFIASMIPSPYKNRTLKLERILLLRRRCTHNNESALSSRQQVSRGVFDLANAKAIAAFLALLPAFDHDLFGQRHRHTVLDRKFGGNGQLIGELGDLAHGFVQQHRDDPAMREAGSSSIARTQNRK